MWEKAQDLARDEMSIVKAPGSENAWMIKSYSNKQLCIYVSRCNGCKGKILRDVNKRPLPFSDDIVFGHKEYVVFNNPRTGLYEQSREKNVYYHVRRSCVVPQFADFSSHHIIIPDNVMPLLQVQHKELPWPRYRLPKKCGWMDA